MVWSIMVNHMSIVVKDGERLYETISRLRADSNNQCRTFKRSNTAGRSDSFGASPRPTRPSLYVW